MTNQKMCGPDSRHDMRSSLQFDYCVQPLGSSPDLDICIFVCLA